MSSYSTSLIPSGIQILPSAIDFPAVGLDGQQLVAADTNTIYIYQEQAPAGWKPVANPGAAIAIDALTGEVTATGPGVVAATITNAAVTNAKLAAMADNTVKGNKSGAPASPSDLALSSVTEAVSSVLTISNGSKTVVSAADLTIEVKQSSAVQSGYLSSTDWSTFNSKQPAGNYITALTGEVTATGPGSVAATIAANAVTNAKLAQMAANTIKGNNTAGLSDPLDLTTAQTTAMLDVMVGDSGTGGTKGLVPAPVAGDATKYLRGDATWQTISLLPAYSQDKVLYSTASAAEWRTVGLGSTDSSYPSGVVILGRTKPVSLTGTNNTIIGVSAATALGTGTDNVLIGTSAAVNVASGAGAVNNVAIGSGAGSSINGNSVCVGANSNVVGQAVAIGSSASAQNGGVAIGYGITSTGGGVAILGNPYGSGSTGGVAIKGVANTDGIAIGGYNSTGYTKGISIGFYNFSGNGNNNIAIGHNCVANTVSALGGNNNLLLGNDNGAGFFAGSNNTIIGNGALSTALTLTSASNNTVVGQGCLNSLTTGSRLTILGQAASTALTTQTDIVAAGYQSGKSGASNYDTLLGVETAFAASPTGNGRNVLAGYRAGYNPGFYQTVVGYQAAYSNNQNYCTAVGYEALNNANGIGNVGIAMQSLQNAVGDNNIGIGYQAGLDITGNQSICLGVWAGSRATAGKELYIANTSARLASNALEKTNSLVYGVFNDTVGSQRLTINGQVNLTQGEKHASVHAQTGTANVITATVNNYYIGVDSTLAAKTVNLPAAATAGQGFVLVIKDEAGTAATNNVTLQASGAETIDGTNTKVIAANYGSLSLMCSGSAWFIM